MLRSCWHSKTIVRNINVLQCLALSPYLNSIVVEEC